MPLPPAATVAVQLLLLHLSSPAQVCCAAQVRKCSSQAVECNVLPKCYACVCWCTCSMLIMLTNCTMVHHHSGIAASGG